MSFAFNTTALANVDESPIVLSSSESGIWVVRTNVDGSKYLENTRTGEKIIEVYGYNKYGRLQKVNLVEYAKELNQTYIQQEQGILLSKSTPSSLLISDGQTSKSSGISLPTQSYSYKQTQSYKGIGSAQKCTPDVVGPASLSYGQSFSVTNSFGASISLNSGAQRAIKAGATFSWSISLSTASNFGLVYTVPANMTGYVRFRPYYNVTKGTLSITYLQDGKLLGVEKYSVWGQSPIKTASGFADGKYELVTY